MSVRVIVTGCRRWEPKALARHVVERLVAKHGDGLVIVHGAAGGVDNTFDVAAIWAGVQREPHPAMWKDYGPAAGPKRNEEMVRLGADLCLAVHRDIRNSKGTRGCAILAINAGIPTYLIDSEDIPAVPRKITEADL